MPTARIIIVIILLLGSPCTIWASSARLHVAGHFPDIALDIERGQTNVTYEDSNTDAEIRHWMLGVSVADEVVDWLKIRFSLGHLGLSLEDSLGGDSFDPTGNYLSLTFDFYQPVSDALALAGEVNYRHLTANDERDSGELKYSIDQAQATISAIFRIGDKFSLQIGSGNFGVDGRERVFTGGQSTVNDFESSRSTVGLLRGIFHVGRTGRVGVTAGFGAQNVLSVYFRRTY